MISKSSVKKPFTVLVGVVLILVLGVVSLTKMQTDLLPSMSVPYLMVITTYPGASPEKVQNDVTEPLESALGTVNGVENVTSISNENYSMVMLEFAEDTNMDSAMVKVSAEINQMADSLPDLVSTPTIMEVSMDMMATQYVAVDCEGMDIYELSDYVEEEIIPALERTAGVASVSATGLVEKTVEVTLNQDKIDQVNDKLLVKVSDRLAEAKETLEDAQKELADAKAELADGRQQLEDGKAELASGKQELEDKQDELADQQSETARQLAELSQQLDEAMATIAATNVQIQSAEAQKAALDEAVKQLEEADAAYTQLDNGLAMMKAALLSNLDTQLAGLDAAIKATDDSETLAGLEAQEAALEALKSQISALPDSMAELVGDGETATVEAGLNGWKTLLASLPEGSVPAEQQAALDSIQSLTADQVLQLNTVHTTTLADTRKQQQQAAAQVTALQSTKKTLEEQAAKLREAYTQLEEGKINAAAGFGSGSAQLAYGISALESAEKQLDSTESQLDSGEEQIKTSEEQLADAWEEYYDAREEALANANLDDLLNMQTLAQLIYAQNFSMPAGYIQDGDQEYLLKVGDTFESVEELEGALLCNIDGVGDVRLRDVADIRITDNADDAYAKVDKNQAVVLAIYKGSTASTSAVADACNARAEELMAGNESLKMTTIMDQGMYIKLIINSVVSNLAWGAVLAIIVLALFLKDVRPTAVVAISMPLSVLFAILLMYFSNITLNIISLSGLALGIGMLVDNSVVVIENIYRLRSRGVPAARAAVQGARQVSGAIASSTVTTICVFLPFLFTEGLVRQLLMDMALTITFSLLASLIIALTVVPAAGSTILRRTREIRHPWFEKVLCGYEKALRLALRHKVVPLALAVVLLVGSVSVMLSGGVVLLPDMSSNQITISYELPEDTADADAFAAADTLMERVMDVEGIETVGAMSANGATAMMGMETNDGPKTSFTYYVVTDTESGRSQSEVTDDIQAVTAGLPGEIRVSGGGMSDMSSIMGSGMEVNIYGKNSDTLLELSHEVEDILNSVEGITEVSNGQEEGDTEIRVIINKDEAMRLGLTVAQVYSELAQALTTDTTSTTLTVGDETYEVNIVDTTKTPDLNSIFDYEFETTTTDEDGNQVKETHKLKEFATRKTAESMASIQRENQSQYITVTSSTEKGYNTSQLSGTVQEKLDQMTLPDGYTVEIAGEMTQINEMVTQMVNAMLLALVLIYLVMVAQFQSLLSPFIVLFTIPLAFTGGALGLVIAGEPLSIVSLMGFLILMGVVVNNGIVFVDYTNQLRIGGMSRTAALVATGKTRMRPILMTTLTTVLAMVTMILSSDAGSEMGRGMAIVVVGGLLYATLMTLFIIPILYDIFFKKEPSNVDVGDEGMDDLPDDAAQFLAELEAEDHRNEGIEPGGRTDLA
ncbi:MAG: efflux RND transporter permease subunit [Gemmiger sp.]